MYLKTRKFPCVRAHIGNLINYMRTDTKDLLTNRFGGNGIKTLRLHSEYLTGVLSGLSFQNQACELFTRTKLDGYINVGNRRNFQL